MPGEPESSAHGDSGPITEHDVPPSSVNASAPTLQGDSDPSGMQRPVLVRTPLPPGPLDAAVGPLSSTTATSTPNGSAVARISTTLRTGSRSLIGQTLGRYEILDELGHGGMATVYRARDPRLERDVALKVIHRHLRDNAEIAQRFRHEARAVAKLKHPSIVEIYDVPDENDEDERFLVAELVEGPSLRKYLSELRKELGEEHPGLFPPELAGALVLQVLGALGRAHAEGIVHRDVKPENILMANVDPVMRAPNSEPRGSHPDRPSPTSSRVPAVAKLTDFGIAKILDAVSMTSTGQILGSPAHMAPEQIEAGDISPKVDVFATGVLFYELMTGSLPFDGKNPAQVIRRVLEGSFTPADRVVPQIGGRWSTVVAHMLAREPENRPASTQACEELIRRELDAMGVIDPDRELVEFMRDPKTIAAGWGARLKPRLLERAVAARETSDVVGAANDLNRALAYDPNDPKLMRAVTMMRSRERQIRGLRRSIPLVLAALLVSFGTFVAVRWSRTHVKPVPSTSATIAPSPIPSPSSAQPSASASTLASAKPSASVITTAVVAPTQTASAVAKTRMVKLSFFPPVNEYQVDEASHTAFELVLPLSPGKHSVTAPGMKCCEPLKHEIFVPVGDDDLAMPTIALTLKPVIITVIGAENPVVSLTVAGKELARGPAPLSVPMKTTQLEAVTVRVEASGVSPKSETYATLLAGDVRLVSFEK